MRKFKPKLSFGSTHSGPRSSPSCKQEKVPEIFEHLATLKKDDDADRHCDVAGNPTQPPVSQHFGKGELLMTRITTGDTYYVRSSSERVKHSEKYECEASASAEVVQNQTSSIVKAEAIVDEKPEPKVLTEADEAARKVGDVPQDKGPSQENDLLEYLRGPCKAQLIVEGTLTAFLDGRYEELYSFLYYHDLDDERGESGCSSFVQKRAATGSCLACSTKDSGRQYAVTRDGRPCCTCTNSSSGTSSEPIKTVESEGQTKCPVRTAGAWSPHLLVVRCKSRRRCGKRATTRRLLTRGGTLSRGSVSCCVRCPSETHKSRCSERGRELSEAAGAREVQQHRAKIDKLLNRPAECDCDQGQPQRRERAHRHGRGRRSGQRATVPFHGHGCVRGHVGKAGASA